MLMFNKDLDVEKLNKDIINLAIKPRIRQNKNYDDYLEETSQPNEPRNTAIIDWNVTEIDSNFINIKL